MRQKTCCQAVEESSITWRSVKSKRFSKYLLRMDQEIYISTPISTPHTYNENKVLPKKAPHFLFSALRVPEVCKSYTIVHNTQAPEQVFYQKTYWLSVAGQLKVVFLAEWHPTAVNWKVNPIFKNLSLGHHLEATWSLYCTAELWEVDHQRLTYVCFFLIRRY